MRTIKTGLSRLLSPIFAEIIKTTRAYRKHKDWPETIVALNNGDCLWVASLAAWVMRYKHECIVEMRSSRHHYYLVDEAGLAYDTIFPRGGDVSALLFYIDQVVTAEPLRCIRLEPWDKDIKVIIDAVCKHFHVPSFKFTGSEFEDEEVSLADITEEEVKVLYKTIYEFTFSEREYPNGISRYLESASPLVTDEPFQSNAEQEATC